MIEYNHYRWYTKPDRWEYNHRSSDPVPIPRSTTQQVAWAKAKWKSEIVNE